MVIMFEQLKSIYQGKKVFLTGHTGFKGSWMLKLLNMLGAVVKGYALAPLNDNDLFYLIKGNELSESVISDIRQSEKLISEMVDFEPDFVFHLAAQPLVRLSYEIPAETFEVNAIGTANVMDGIRKLKKACYAVMITTDKVYHNYEWIYPYRETDRLGGYDPYSASKACAELVIDSYRNCYFNIHDYDKHLKAVAVARAGNVIGGGDWSIDRLIPDIVKSLSANKRIIIRKPQAVRPWQHVLDPIAAYLLLGAKLVADPVKYMQAYNFGPYTSDTLAVSDMVKLAIDAWGNGSYMIRQDPNQPHEAGLLKLDISKAETELKWHPKTNASQAVQFTIDWYKAYFYDKETIDQFTEKQIIEFFKIGSNE
jgi:CDP-glucose 4,6-dehydratase